MIILQKRDVGVTLQPGHTKPVALAKKESRVLLQRSGRIAAPVVTIPITLEGGGVELQPGVKCDIPIPFRCKITGWTIIADEAGSITFDLWKTDFANAPATVVNSVATFSMTSAIKAFGNLDFDIEPDDIIRVNVPATSTVERITLILRAERT